MNICILLYLSLYVIIYGGRTNFFSLSQLIPSPSKFVIITKNSTDDSKSEENDLTKYDTVNNPGGVRYKFKNGSKCVGLKYDDTSIWTYDSQINGEKYPVEIFFNSLTNNVRIKTENRLYIYSYRNDNWDLTFDSEVASAPLSKYQLFTNINDDLTISPGATYYSKTYINHDDASPILAVSSNEFVRRLYDSHIQILTVDSRLRLKVNDLTHFFVTKFQNLTTYELVNLRMYCEVKHKDEVVWLDKRHRSEADFPDLIHIYTDKDVVCLDFSGKKFLVFHRRTFDRYSGCIEKIYGEPYIKIEDDNTTSFHLKLKFDGSSGSADTTVLEIKPTSPGVSKKFNDGEKCVEITSENKRIWKHDPLRDGANYPTEVYSDSFKKRIVKIKFAGRAYLYSFAHDKWSLKTLSIDDSSSHRMDTEPIDGLDGDASDASSEEYVDAKSTIGESTDSSTTEQSTEVPPRVEESSTSPDSTESTLNEPTDEPTSGGAAESIPTQSTILPTANESTNEASTDLSSEDPTNKLATSRNGSGESVIESSVYP
nr:hypothetical protein MACL_00000108 [Theileria orientalis]